MSPSKHTVDERILDFDCCETAGESGGRCEEVMVSVCGCGSPKYFCAKAGWYVDAMSSVRTIRSAE